MEPRGVQRFPGEEPNDRLDTWLQLVTIPPRPRAPYHVALIALWLGEMPPWMDYTARSLSFARDQGAPALSAHGSPLIFVNNFKNNCQIICDCWLLHRFSGIELFIFGNGVKIDFIAPELIPNVHVVNMPMDDILARLHCALVGAGVPDVPGLTRGNVGLLLNASHRSCDAGEHPGWDEGGGSQTAVRRDVC